MSRQALPLFENLHRSIILCLDSLTSPLSHARQAHAHFIKTSISSDSYLATKLISLYANHNCFSDANLVFDSVPEQTLFSFSSVIREFAKSNHFSLAFRMFSQMISQGIMPDDLVLPSFLKACSGLKLLKAGRQVHCFASVSGFESDLVLQSSLMHLYLRCDRIKDARKVFDRLPQPDVVTFSALLSGYARHGLVEEAKELFSEIGNLGVEPNLFSWNGMITGFNHSGQYMEAVSVFRNMISEGFTPDNCSISSALSAASDMENLGFGVQIHGHAIKQGLELNNCILSALIDMYGKAGRVVEMSGVFNEMIDMDLVACNAFITGLYRNGHYHHALSVFEQIKCQGMELNVTSWTSMIAGCSQNGKDIRALELFREMQIEGVKPNSVTIPCLLPACGNIAALNHGKAAHCFSIRQGFSDDVCVGSVLIDMYAKCGRIQLSRLCFQNMPTRNLACWNAIMGGYGMHGKANEAMETFDMMQRSGQKPDFISFTCILSACCQGGLTDKGEYYFDSMSRDHGIEPRVEHYACMVNLLSRAGRLDEAHAMIKQMPVEPDACVWGALLSSCKIHNNVNLGEVAAKKLFELEPSNPGNYVLLSNIYASKAMWAEVDTLRDTMNNMGLKKNPGCSWIELKNKVHVLLAGDKSHPQMMQIFEKLAELSMEMKKSGYLPHTDFVMQDVEEQDKEQILCGHSEKLAVVLGLINTGPGTPLQVIKNIRICGDCHSVIKFISSFERREIFVRDTNRFHHFKEGVCSCGDYW